MSATLKTRRVYAAFCGTGKSHLCAKYPSIISEVECWKYESQFFPQNYVCAVVDEMVKHSIVFVSTNPSVLLEFVDLNIEVILIYPDISLKEEYIQRFKDRGSSNDFISTLTTNWDKWITELMNLPYESHVLKSGEYLNKVVVNECHIGWDCKRYGKRSDTECDGCGWWCPLIKSSKK
jgi:hypothetical protein